MWSESTRLVELPRFYPVRCSHTQVCCAAVLQNQDNSTYPSDSEHMLVSAYRLRHVLPLSTVIDFVDYNVFPGDHSRLEPPETIPNSVVKHSSADDSVGFPHVKVGHRQGFIPKSQST